MKMSAKTKTDEAIDRIESLLATLIRFRDHGFKSLNIVSLPSIFMDEGELRKAMHGKEAERDYNSISTKVDGIRFVAMIEPEKKRTVTL